MGVFQGLSEPVGVGIEVFEQGFKFSAMVHVDGVAEFVDDDMPEEIGRKKEDRGIEGYAAR